MVDPDGAKEPVRVTWTDGFDGLPVPSPDGTQHRPGVFRHGLSDPAGVFRIVSFVAPSARSGEARQDVAGEGLDRREEGALVVGEAAQVHRVVGRI